MPVALVHMLQGGRMPLTFPVLTPPMPHYSLRVFGQVGFTGKILDSQNSGPEA
jgi:hypothetical protein